MDDESLRQKYSDLLLDNLRLQEKLMVKDRIIEERVFFPIYHYDQRVTTLRRAMVHWYKKAEEECSRMRKRCRDMKQGLGEEMENMRQVMNQELESYRSQLKCIISEDSLIKKRPKEEKAEKKARVGRDNPSKPELKRLR
jgi:vacuolar-type H+-ATPase catalytic subunit A/Vma1